MGEEKGEEKTRSKLSNGGSEIKGGEKLVKRAKGWGGGDSIAIKASWPVILDGEGVGEGERGLLVGRATARVTYEESATGVATSTSASEQKLLRAIFSPVLNASVDALPNAFQ